MSSKHRTHTQELLNVEAQLQILHTLQPSAKLAQAQRYIARLARQAHNATRTTSKASETHWQAYRAATFVALQWQGGDARQHQPARAAEILAVTVSTIRQRCATAGGAYSCTKTDPNTGEIGIVTVKWCAPTGRNKLGRPRKALPLEK